MVANQFFHITTNVIWHMGWCFHIRTDQHIWCHCVSTNHYRSIVHLSYMRQKKILFHLDFYVPVLLWHKRAFLMEF